MFYVDSHSHSFRIRKCLQLVLWILNKLLMMVIADHYWPLLTRAKFNLDISSEMVTYATTNFGRFWVDRTTFLVKCISWVNDKIECLEVLILLPSKLDYLMEIAFFSLNVLHAIISAVIPWQSIAIQWIGLFAVILSHINRLL